MGTQLLTGNSRATLDGRSAPWLVAGLVVGTVVSALSAAEPLK